MITDNSFQEFYLKGDKSGKVTDKKTEIKGASFFKNREMETSLVAQTVKHLPTRQDTWVRTLGWEDPLEKEMATHCSTLAWKIPCLVKLQCVGSQRVGHD